MALRMIQVGMGGWGLSWGAIVRRYAETDLVACVDANPEALMRAQHTLKIPAARCFTTLEAALAATPADAVLITTSLGAHIPVACTALAAGVHVLLEKPFGPSLVEAQHAVETAAAQHRMLMISQNYRFFPAVHAAASLVHANTLGTVGAVSLDFRRNANSAPREGNRHYHIRHPLLIDMAIHHFDLMRFVLGQEPTTITCQAWNPPWSNFADPAAACATITFAGGAIVNYRGSWVSPAPQTTWAGTWNIECAGGDICWASRSGQGIRGDRVIVRPLGKAAQRNTLPNLPHLDREGSLAAFVQAVREGHEPESSGRDNLGSLALAIAAVESAETGRPIRIPELFAKSEKPSKS